MAGRLRCEIGANDPIALSNSYVLESRGWNGIAIDPLPWVADVWRSQRRTTFHQAAIADELAVKEFVEFFAREGWEHALSGFRECARAEHLHMYEHQIHFLNSTPLHAVLPSARPVDLILIDVEGSEELVLRGIDFDSIRPQYLLIENVSRLGGGQAIRQYVHDRGYELVARIGAADDFFQRTRGRTQ